MILNWVWRRLGHGEEHKSAYIGNMTTVAGLPNYHHAKSEALKILDQFGFSDPPVDPARVARSLGTEVVFVELDPEDNNVSGFYDFKENAIFVNRAEYAPRQTFTIAHELGHKILHADWVKSTEYTVLLRDSLADAKDPKEQEANAFAAHLLVPRFMLERYRSVATVRELADLFAVSEPVIRNRLKFEYGT